jgi:hypothetical protein
MTLYQFELLSKNQQLVTTKRDGVFVARRGENGFNIYLFQLGSFYVEIHLNYYYDIGWLRSFCCLDQLDPYLKSINIPKVEECGL